MDEEGRRRFLWTEMLNSRLTKPDVDLKISDRKLANLLKAASQKCSNASPSVTAEYFSSPDVSSR
jgi:hypothetical protein